MLSNNKNILVIADNVFEDYFKDHFDHKLKFCGINKSFIKEFLNKCFDKSKSKKPDIFERQETFEFWTTYDRVIIQRDWIDKKSIKPLGLLLLNFLKFELDVPRETKLELFIDCAETSDFPVLSRELNPNDKISYFNSKIKTSRQSDENAENNGITPNPSDKYFKFLTNNVIESFENIKIIYKENDRSQLEHFSKLFSQKNKPDDTSTEPDDTPTDEFTICTQLQIDLLFLIADYNLSNDKNGLDYLDEKEKEISKNNNSKLIRIIFTGSLSSIVYRTCHRRGLDLVLRKGVNTESSHPPADSRGYFALMLWIYLISRQFSFLNSIDSLNISDDPKCCLDQGILLRRMIYGNGSQLVPALKVNYESKIKKMLDKLKK